MIIFEKPLTQEEFDNLTNEREERAIRIEAKEVINRLIECIRAGKLKVDHWCSDENIDNPKAIELIDNHFKAFGWGGVQYVKNEKGWYDIHILRKSKYKAGGIT